MSMRKAIKSGKEHRKEYRGAKSVDYSCRNHGGCDWCKGNRQHKFKKSEEKAKSKLKEIIDNDNYCGTWKMYIKNTEDKWAEVSVAKD